MNQPAVDWTTDPDQPSVEEEYRALVRSLRRSQGFDLMFVECSPATGSNLIERLPTELPQKSMGVLSFDQPVPGGNLYHQVGTYLHDHPVEVLFIQGLEHSIFEYEDAQRLSGWTEAQIYSMSWQGLPPLMRNLNWYREDFRDNLPPVCLVFLVRSFFVNYLLHRAPDFFDWRSGLFQLPLDPKALEQQCQLALGDYDEYLTWSSPQRIQKILEIRDLLVEPHQTQEQQAKLLLEIGSLFHTDQRYEEAIASYDRALQVNPDDYAAWYNRGNALSNLGHDEEAITSYDRAVVIKPDYHEVWINRGIALGNLGRYEEAITSYDRALQMNPSDYWIWNNRGNALADLERYEEAIESFDHVIQISPDEYWAWVRRGSILGDLKRYEEAIESYDRALHLNPNDDSVWENRGDVLLMSGHHEEAISSYDRSIAIKPDDHSAWNKRGVNLMFLGRYEQAIAGYDRAVAIKPDYHHAWSNRGYALVSLGRYEEAIVSYEKALMIRREVGDKQAEAQSLQVLAGLYQQVGRVREGLAVGQQMTQILKELDTPLEEMPFPNWLKPIAKFASQGNWQVGLVCVVALVASPAIVVALLWVVGLVLWRWLRSRFRQQRLS